MHREGLCLPLRQRRGTLLYILIPIQLIFTYTQHADHPIERASIEMAHAALNGTDNC